MIRFQRNMVPLSLTRLATEERGDVAFATDRRDATWSERFSAVVFRFWIFHCHAKTPWGTKKRCVCR